VIEPYSGEILAMSNYPAFDPNARRVTASDVAARTNNAISAPFEPGSVFKTVTLAAALENSSLGPESLIDCGPGVMRLFGRRIHDLHAYGTIPVKTVLAKSSNIGVIQIGLEAGEAKLHEYIRRFGFGRRTGIPLPGESSGLVWDLEKWSRTSIGSVAMGHEMLATSLQLALATSVIANGGTLPQPRLILWREKPGEGRAPEPMATPRRVIEPRTAITLRRMMEGVVLEGTGQRARFAGYSSGGKTGSAQIYDPVEQRYLHEYNSSFVGFAPVQDPKIVVAVTLHHATKYGGVVAAPVFREVASEALRILGVIPDVPSRPLGPEPDVEDLKDLAIADLGGGATRELEAVEPAARPEPQVTAYVRGPEVPDLYGLTLRDVLTECARLGLEIEYQGSGLARSQDPAPGTVLPVGRRVRVMFTR
jgi:cell division protein FtsI/penicillin-binding protein 2